MSIASMELLCMPCKILSMSVGTGSFASSQDSIHLAMCRVHAVVSLCCCAAQVSSGEICSVDWDMVYNDYGMLLI